MKKQVFELLKNTFSFVVSSFLSQNPVEYISLNVVINEKDKMKVCTTQMRSFSIVQKDNRNPEIKIHESSVLSSTVDFWFHGYDFAENMNPFEIEVEIDEKQYKFLVEYNKETKWFSVYGDYLNTVWCSSLKKKEEMLEIA